MKRPSVSVVVPIYKVEAFIEHCAKSLFVQTLEDIEYVFVDDCSPDKSIEILETVIKKYPKKEKQVKLIRLPQNLGAAKAREIGIKASSGDYIIHCDSDDWVEASMYEKMYLKARKENLCVVISEYSEMVGNKPKRVVRQCLGTDPFYTVVSEPAKCSLWNKLVKREIYENNRFAYPVKHMMEDEVICAQIFYYAHTVGYIDEPLYNYNLHSDSISHVENEKGHLKRWHDAYENVKIVDSFVKLHCNCKKYSQAVAMLKFQVKGYLMPLLKISNRFYKEWYNTFPEINYRIIFLRGLSNSLRLVYIITLIGAYPLFLKLKMTKRV